MAAETPSTGVWSACLVLVAAYDDISPAVEAAVVKAHRSVMLSPALGDFAEMRFHPLGPRRWDGDDHPATALVGDLITERDGSAPVNYSAIVVVDDDAGGAAAVLEAAAIASEDAGLDVALRGLATAEDRDAEARADGEPVAILPSGAPLDEALARALVTVCEDVMAMAAAGELHGMTPEDLSAHGPGPDPAPEGDARSLAELAEALPDAPAPTAPDAGRRDTRADRLPRLRPRRRIAVPAASTPAPTGSIPALTFVALAGGATGAPRTAVRHAQEVVLAIDAAFAELPSVVDGVSHAVVVIGPDGDVIELPRAGRGRRRAAPRPARLTDLASQLRTIEAAMGREMNLLIRRRGRAARPWLVLVAPEPPIADAGSTRLIAGLRTRASLAWVLVGDSADLLSDRLRDGAAVLHGHKTIGEDVCTRVAGPRPAPPEPAAEGSDAKEPEPDLTPATPSPADVPPT